MDLMTGQNRQGRGLEVTGRSCAIRRLKFWSFMFLSLAYATGFLLWNVPTARGNETVAEIRIADSTGDFGYPNPFLHYPRGPGYVRMSWVFDTLVWKDRDGIVPALAESWRYDSDAEAFEFQINPKARWHDGKPVTASDVAFTVSYFKKHPYRWITLDPVDRVDVRDDLTALIYLKNPYAPFLSEIGGSMPILPQHIWESIENPETETSAAVFVGSGPYLFKDFNKVQGTYLFEAFPHYYQGRPRVDRLIYIRSGKPMVSLSTGQADLAGIQPEMASALEKKGMIILRDERGWNRKLMINHRKPPLDDRRFRQALAHAISQEELIRKGQRGLASPASYGLLSVDHEMFNPQTPAYAHDPDKARALLESMGFVRGSDGTYEKEGVPLRLELLSSGITAGGEAGSDRDGIIIRQQLEAVGIRVDLLTLELATTDSRIRNWQFDLAVSGHGGISGDPKFLNEMISPVYGAGSVNSARYDANARLNDLLEAQVREMDPDRRKELVYEIQKIIAEDLPSISLYYPQTTAAYDPRKGIHWFYTRGGIGKGIPIPQNKMALIPRTLPAE